MISDKLRGFIEPNLLLHLSKKDWGYVDDMFSEVYLTNFDGIERVTLKPHPHAGQIALQFATLNGAFLEITDWEYIKKVGTLL